MGGWVSFSEVKSRLPLEHVLRWYGVDWLRRSGTRQYRGRCPIHGGEGKEAFHVNYERNVFHCFACGAGGNVLDFVRAMDQCTMRQAALRLVAATDGGGILTTVVSETARSKLVTKKSSINPPLTFSLTVDRRHPYLAQRGIEGQTADYFGVGYFARPGLMSGRITIPIHNAGGVLVAYSGRALYGDEPRYRFPAGFRKSQVLFNYHRARTRTAGQIIVVEGFFDCMRVHQAGFPNVIALMGAQLSAAQKDLLLGSFSQIALMLDGDQTGRSATAQIARDLASSSCSVVPILVPVNVQPDQMTADQVRQLLAPEFGRRQNIEPH